MFRLRSPVPNLHTLFYCCLWHLPRLFQPAVQDDSVRSALRRALAQPASCVTDSVEHVCVRAEKMTANKVMRPRVEDLFPGCSSCFIQKGRKKPTSACRLLCPQTRRSRPAASWFHSRQGRRSLGGPSVASWCWSSWWCCCWCCCSSTGGGRRTSRATRPPSPSPPAAQSTPSTPSQVQCRELLL